MSRKISSATSLDNLKREAKRWLRALRSGDAEARARLARSLGKISDEPTLRDVQHALALEYGLAGWNELRAQIESRKEQPAVKMPEGDREELIEWFLENACPDHHVRGEPDHIMARHSAMRVLSEYPEIAHVSLHTAVVCGDVETVRRILAENPAAAREKSGTPTTARTGVGGDGDRFKRRMGALGWEPLLHLAFARLSLPAASENSVEIARLLLDNGADPNAFFTAGDSRYTPLSGVIGEGEENHEPHPRRNELVSLLLDRGANPYDIQVVYNTGFSYARGDVIWFLKLIYERALDIGRKWDWDDPEWRMLDMGGYGSGARWYLDLALKHNNLQLAQWCLEHGASANAKPARDRRFPQRSLLEEAARAGMMEFAQLLVRHGAEARDIRLKGNDGFTAACLRLDVANARRMLAKNPKLLRVPEPMMLAAHQDRAEAVELLLDLGMSPDINDGKRSKQVALHVAAYAGSVRVVELLIQRGATIDVFDAEHGGTPLWFAVYGHQQRATELLSAVSRDIWSLSLTGNVARLREVLKAEPELARAGEKSGETALFYLPGDDVLAVQIAELFVSLGTDVSVINKDGFTAGQLALKRGLVEAAAVVGSG